MHQSRAESNQCRASRSTLLGRITRSPLSSAVRTGAMSGASRRYHWWWSRAISSLPHTPQRSTAHWRATVRRPNRSTVARRSSCLDSPGRSGTSERPSASSIPVHGSPWASASSRSCCRCAGTTGRGAPVAAARTGSSRPVAGSTAVPPAAGCPSGTASATAPHSSSAAASSTTSGLPCGRTTSSASGTRSVPTACSTSGTVLRQEGHHGMTRAERCSSPASASRTKVPSTSSRYAGDSVCSSVSQSQSRPRAWN